MPEHPPEHAGAPVDARLIEAGRLFLLQAYGQDADLFTGSGSQAQRVARSAGLLRPADREGLLHWFSSLQHEADEALETLLRHTLRLEFQPRGWEHPDGLPLHGAGALLRFLLEGLRHPQPMG